MAKSVPIVSLVIPIHNEEDMVERTILEISRNMKKSFGNSFEIICSENGSTDNTLRILKKLEAKHPEIKVISTADSNIGKATRKGYLKAKGTYLTNASVDWYDLDFVKLSILLLRDNDIVVGTKSMPGCDKRPFLRRLISKGYNISLKVLFGLRVTDTHSLTVYNRKRVLPIIKASVMGKSVFSSEVIIRAQQSELKIAEKDLVVHEQRKRKKSIIARTIMGFFDLIRLRMILWKESLKR